MKALILTEAGKRIGFGHISRCIGLYQGLKEKNIDIELIVNADSSTNHLLKGINHKRINWLKNSEIIFKKLESIDIAIIDSYLADLDFYKKVSEIVKIPVYIDDYKRLDYPKGVVINPSIYGNKLNYPKKDGINYLLGKDYIILRKEFWQIPKKKINKKIKNVLITFGGINHQKLAKKIAKHLKNKFNFNTYIVEPNKNLSAKDMLKLMLKADLCISGGGQTTYELAWIGVPTIGICFADNQLNNLIYGEKEGYLKFAGWFNDEELLRKIENFLIDLNYEKRVKMNKIGQESVDGRGVKRLLKTIN